MRLSKIAIVLILGFILTTCRSKSPSNFEGGGTAMDLTQSTELATPPAPEAKTAEQSLTENQAIQPEIVVERKIIRNGSAEVRVNDIGEGKRQVDSLLKKYKGYYAGEVYNNMDVTHSYSLSIRIPAGAFDNFLNELGNGVGEIAYKNINSQDVTEQFIDLETRLKNKRNYMVSYRALLQQARSVKDILDIEEKIRVIEEEIESAEGKLKYLNNQVDYSTLELQITRKNDYSKYSRIPGTFTEKLKLSFAKGWFGLVSFSLFVVRLWAFWIIAGILFYFIRKRLRRNKK